MNKKTNESKENCSEILGQSICYPSTWQAVCGILTVISGICVITYLVLVAANQKNLNSVIGGFTAKIYTSEGKKIDTKSYLIGFWTPSELTQNYSDNSNVNDWEVLDNNDRVVEFGSKLSKVDNILGYRRYRVYGEGSNGAKEGWWWVMRVNDKYFSDDFLSIYRGFWSQKANVYMEITGYGGKYH